MYHVDPASKEQRGLDPRAFMGGGRSRSSSTRKQLGACCLGLAVLLVGALIFAIVLGLLAPR